MALELCHSSTVLSYVRKNNAMKCSKYLKTKKRIIDSTLVILSLMLIFGCKESKVGQGNPTKDSMSIDTDSVISGKVFTKQDIASEDTLNAVIRAQSPKSKDFF